MITIRDCDGKKLKKDTYTVSVRLWGNDGFEKTELSYEGDGKYLMEFVPNNTVSYLLEVKLNGKEIPGSPFIAKSHLSKSDIVNHLKLLVSF